MISARSLAAAAVVAAGLTLGVDAARAQEPVRVAGFVQWVGGNTMSVMTGVGSVPIDLREADQSSYAGLRAGERIVVDGILTGDRSRVIARDIRRAGGGYESP